MKVSGGLQHGSPPTSDRWRYGPLMNDFEIIRLDPVDLSMAIATTSRAFWPDPLFGHFANDVVQEHRMLPTFLGAMLRDAASHGEVWVAKRDGVVVGSASWLQPGTMPRPRSRENRITRACASALLTGRNRRSGLKLLSAVEKKHPSEPHWYLPLLGIDPKWQGRGLGGLLLRVKLEQCDAMLMPVYLETQKPENVPYYERFGFLVTEVIELPATPPIWLMWRDPVPSE
jgi:GNAT superfamily N-acetyltransferase